MMFGAYGSIVPQEFKFERDPSLTWTVRPTTWADEAFLDQRLNAGYQVRYVDGVPIREVNNGILEPVQLRIWRTFEATNIVDEKGKPYLTKDMSEEEFMARLGAMPPEMIYEIYGFVLQVNPQWDIARPNP